VIKPVFERSKRREDCQDFMWQPANSLTSMVARRHPDNPLVSAHSSPAIGANINGPSVIRVPPWLKKPLGKYYMYFAHHKGTKIRLAYADAPGGPWTVYEPGTLKLDDVEAMQDHIASPDVHVDETRRVIRMYFHGPARDRPGQWTCVATSRDGLFFEPLPEILGKFYFRVWCWEGDWYAIAKDDNSGWGLLYRSKDGLSDFQCRGPFLKRIRHAAVLVRDPYLVVFYTRKGDAPEHIVVSTIDLRLSWEDWIPSKTESVLQPEMDYEGIAYPNKPSHYGAATEVRQLRDPCIFVEDERACLYYSFAGEMGIALANLEMTFKNSAAPGHYLLRLADKAWRKLTGHPL